MVTSYIAKAADLVLLPLSNLHPILSLLILSIVFSIALILYQRNLFNKKGIEELRIKMNKIREELMRTSNKSQEEVSKLWNEMLKINLKLIKENIKVLILSVVIGTIFVSWISFRYSGYHVKLPFPLFSELDLIYFYIILCIVLGAVIGKFLGVK